MLKWLSGTIRSEKVGEIQEASGVFIGHHMTSD